MQLLSMKILFMIAIFCKRLGISPKEYHRLLEEETKSMEWLNEFNRIMIEDLKSKGVGHMAEDGKFVPDKKHE